MVRSEADDLLFKHAETCGVKTFDETKVASIEFSPPCVNDQEFGRPVSATWTRKDGTSGTIALDYVVDASGRNGLISTKYLKNRTYNQGLKNIASWGYWKGGGVHGVGTRTEGAPYFEALKGMFSSRSLGSLTPWSQPNSCRVDKLNSDLIFHGALQTQADGVGLSRCITAVNR